MSPNLDSSNADNEDAGKTESVKCSKCFRELKYSREWICTRDRILCDRCYQGLLYPGARSNLVEDLD